MKKGLISNLVFAFFAALCLCACGSDDDDGNNGNNAIVTVGDDGKTSNGSKFSAIDDKNFYLDYIKYTVEEGHLVVSGYDEVGFKGNANIVKAIRYKGNTYEVLEIDNGAFYGCRSLTSITIPNSVTTIKDDAFYGCRSLTSITIPNSVTWIGPDAFYRCTSLTAIHCKSKQPCEVGNGATFSSDMYSKMTLYIPSGSRSAYASAYYWKYFVNVVEE